MFNKDENHYTLNNSNSTGGSIVSTTDADLYASAV